MNARIVGITTLLAAAAIGSAAQAQKSIQVPRDVATIQEAIAMVVAGGEILVSPGSYPPINLGGKPLSIRGLGMPSDVVIDGDFASRVVDASGVSTGEVVLENLTVANGRLSASSSVGEAGVEASGSTITLRSVIVRDCEILYQGAGINNIDGAGIRVVAGDLTLIDSVVSMNRIESLNTGSSFSDARNRGAGIAVLNGSLAIEDSTISANSILASTSGGSWHDVHALGAGIYAENASVQIQRSAFRSNLCSVGNASSGVMASWSAGGGAFVKAGTSAVSFVECDFSDNATALSTVTTFEPLNYNRSGGAALWIWTGSSCLVKDCLFESNSATASAQVATVIGAAIVAHGATVSIEGGSMHDNQLSGTQGGAVAGGALAVWKLPNEPVPQGLFEIVGATVCGNSLPQLVTLNGAGSVALGIGTIVEDLCPVDPCLGDIVPDGVVDGVDLAALLGAWGSAGGPWDADLTGDGAVDAADLAVLLGDWGGCP
jgi:hypothetical protein